MVAAAGPETRTIPTPPRPGGVAMAAMVSCAVWFMTTDPGSYTCRLKCCFYLLPLRRGRLGGPPREGVPALQGQAYRRHWLTRCLNDDPTLTLPLPGEGITLCFVKGKRVGCFLPNQYNQLTPTKKAPSGPFPS